MEYTLDDNIIIDFDPILPIWGPAIIKSISKNGTELPVDENGNVDITVPTKITDLINDSDFVESSDLSAVAFSGDYNDLSNLPVIPDLTGYATETYVDNSITTHNTSNIAHTDIRNILSGITAMIPAQASDTNQLADKNFVNSSIATSRATFRGTYNEVSDLSLTTAATHSDIATALGNVISTVDENDYCFVQIPTSDLTPTEIAKVEQYKFSSNQWQYEYDLNNSGFTAAQWTSINSGATSTLIGQITTNANDIITLNTTVSSKVSKTGDTMTGDLTLDPHVKINFPAEQSGTYNFYLVNQDTQSAVDIVRTAPDWSSPDRIVRIGPTYFQAIDLYKGTSNNSNTQVLSRSEGDARWNMIQPDTSTATTLVEGKLNTLGTVDYSTIALPATPGTAEYNGTFTDGSVAGGDITQNTGLSSVTYWSGDTTIVTGHSYSFSIQNGVGLIIQLN